jgi:integrase
VKNVLGIQVRRRLAKPMVFGPRGFKSHPRRILTNPLHSHELGDILSFGLWMNKQGYRHSTVHYCVQALKSIARQVSLLDPESVKAYLATMEVSEARKAKLVEDLARFYNWKHTPFAKPNYRRIERLPFVPLESEIDQLISGAGRKTSAFLQLLKETGARPGEAWNLRWTDLDHEKNAVNITPEKNSNPRQSRISTRLMAMLNRLPRRYEYVFRNPKIDPLRSMEVFRRSAARQRRRISERLQNPRVRSITFKTMRHWKATNEYHKTRDILHVMQVLGHKNIRNTLVYTHLVDFHSDEYVCKVARTAEEARQLVENGFDYVTEVEDMKLFRKRK